MRMANEFFTRALITVAGNRTSSAPPGASDCAEAREALPSTMPPVSAAPTWPKNLRRLQSLAASLLEGLAVTVTSAAVFFGFIVISRSVGDFRELITNEAL